MSERWQTAKEIEKIRITLGLQDTVDLLEDKSKKRVQNARYSMLGSGAILATSVLTDRYITHHWGIEQDFYASLGGLLLGFAAVEYRRHKSAKNRAFDVERRKIEVELDTD